MPSPSEASSEVAPPAASAAASPVSAALVAGNHAAPRPSADLRDDTDSSSDDEYADDGFAAAHAAFLARRIADERSAQSSGGAQPAGMSPFDESVINHEWDELVRSMKAIVPSQTANSTPLVHDCAGARARVAECTPTHAYSPLLCAAGVCAASWLQRSLTLSAAAWVRWCLRRSARGWASASTRSCWTGSGERGGGA